MRLQFLGSGDAFGSGGRFNTCFHLERAAHGNVLVDCGASSMVAIRKWQVDPNAVSTVLVSHLHGDHFAGRPFSCATPSWSAAARRRCCSPARPASARG